MHTEFAYMSKEEAQEKQYLHVPKPLILDENFKHLSLKAKLLYALLLDELPESLAKGLEIDGHIYIYFDAEKVAGYLNCGRSKAYACLKELTDTGLLSIAIPARNGTSECNAYYIHSLSRYGEQTA